MNTLLDEGFPKGAFNHWKANFMRSLDDELIDIAVEHFDRTPSQLNGPLFEHFHGAVTRSYDGMVLDIPSQAGHALDHVYVAQAGIERLLATHPRSRPPLRQAH